MSPNTLVLTMAAGNPVHHKPPDVQHGGVMVDMEDCYLVVVLAEDEEEGVHEFYEFGEVVPPQDTDDLKAKGLWFIKSPALFWNVTCDMSYTRIPNTKIKLASPLAPSAFQSLGWAPLMNEHAILGTLKTAAGNAFKTLLTRTGRCTPETPGLGGRSQRIERSGSSLATQNLKL